MGTYNGQAGMMPGMQNGMGLANRFASAQPAPMPGGVNFGSAPGGNAGAVAQGQPIPSMQPPGNIGPPSVPGVAPRPGYMQPAPGPAPLPPHMQVPTAPMAPQPQQRMGPQPVIQPGRGFAWR
jgi:hypothetical protein